MSHVSGCLKAVTAIALAASFTFPHAGHDDAYVVTPLVSNLAGAAPKSTRCCRTHGVSPSVRQAFPSGSTTMPQAVPRSMTAKARR